MPIENHIDQLIEDCITTLTESKSEQCASNMQSLAINYANAGMGLQSFLDTRTYIIQSAKARSNNDSIGKNLEQYEKDLKLKRTTTH